MDLLVAGGDRVDAGKTTFAVGLLAHLRAAGADPAGFKPRAGNDYWFDHDDVLAAAADGRLYGEDARRLAAAAPGEPAPEAINPVHRLWTPTPGRSGPLGEPDRTFLLDRVTTAEGDRFVVNAELALPDPVREALPLAEATEVGSVEAFNEAMAGLHRPALERLGEAVARRDPAVVESYGDIALPLTGFEPDAVAVVRPGQVAIYDGDRYRQARKVASGSPHEGRLEERVGNVTELADPAAVAEIPALPAAEREDPDAIADAYAEAYLPLLDVA